jgi:uncharacterized RDD family membrane protein YckC
VVPLSRRVTGRAIDLALWFAFIVVLSAVTAQTEPDGTQTNPSWVEPLAFVPVFVYEALMLAARGRTLGKMAAGTKVVTGSGAVPRIGRASVRAAITWSFTLGLMLSIWDAIWIVGIALFVITFAPGLVGPSHRTLADLLAGTTVERAEPVEAAGPVPGRPAPMGA